MASRVTKTAFTIIELLVVITVIGILAAVTILAYGSTNQKATVASLSSELTNIAKLLNVEISAGNNLPSSLSSLNSGRGLNTNGITYSYIYNNSSNPPVFCVDARSGSTTYRVMNGSAPSAGTCQPDGIVTNGLILSYDFGNKTSYLGYGSQVTDLSGNYNSATINNPAYTSNNGGGLTFTQSSIQGIMPTIPLWGSTGSREISMEWIAYLDSSFTGWNHLGAGIAGWYYALNPSGYLYAMVVAKDSSGNIVNNWPSANVSTLSVAKISDIMFVMKEDNYVKWYVNGNLISTTNPPFFSYYRFQNNRFSIGRGYNDDGTTQMSGTMYQTRIYNRVLSDSEILQNYNAQKARYGI